MYRITHALWVVAAVGLNGCAMQGRLYNLTAGDVVAVEFHYSGSGSGAVNLTLPDGVRCSGEYSTVAGGTVGWGQIYSSVGGTAMAQGGMMDTTQRGAAVVTCPGGKSIDCEYITSAFGPQGNGYCRDNHGDLYRLMF